MNRVPWVLSCVQCGSEFWTKNSLEKHVEEIHKEKVKRKELTRVEQLSNFDGSIKSLIGILLVLQRKYGPQAEMTIWRDGKVTIIREKEIEKTPEEKK